MAKRSLADQLDQAVEAVLTHPEQAIPPADAPIAPLVRLAVELRSLPREGFQERLKSDLEREATMMKTRAKPVGEGFHTLTPYLVVEGPVEFLDFLKQAFGAEEMLRTTGTAGGMHAELRIGTSSIMMGGGKGIAAIPAELHLYVEDADAVYQRALEAGATSLYEPVDQPYGDREAGVKDPSGNHWYIATHKGASYIPEGLSNLTPCLHAHGAEKLVDFLKEVFDAEETQCERSPEGTIVHAKVQIGDSIVEIAEAHGSWQPMPCMIHMNVDNVDMVYQRALEAGASSIEKPAEQPYGARRAGVKDPFGNQWYVAAPLKRARSGRK